MILLNTDSSSINDAAADLGFGGGAIAFGPSGILTCAFPDGPFGALTGGAGDSAGGLGVSGGGGGGGAAF